MLVDIGGARVAVTEGTVESAAAVAEKAGDPAVHAYLERVAAEAAWRPGDGDGEELLRPEMVLL